MLRKVSVEKMKEEMVVGWGVSGKVRKSKYM
jgi:hypothetical protein